MHSLQMLKQIKWWGEALGRSNFPKHSGQLVFIFIGANSENVDGEVLLAPPSQGLSAPYLDLTARSPEAGRHPVATVQCLAC
jgi:hypothetical protein